MVEMGWPAEEESGWQSLEFDDPGEINYARGYDKVGKHDPWNQPCNGYFMRDFPWYSNPLTHEARHRRDRVNTWYTGMVVWNFATELWDRVKIVDDHLPSMARYRTMSYPIDEDDETEWRQQNG